MTLERMRKRLEKVRERSVAEHDFPQLATTAGLAPTIKDNPLLIFHPADRERDELMSSVRRNFALYRETLPESRRLLLDRFHLMDAALKVVGVGSVGTYCAVLLLMASDDDPLFLQVKQARHSVLEAYAGKSRHVNEGQRVVYGCRVMQSASDMFLGWLEGGKGRHYYVRQLRDMKIKPMVELFRAAVMQEDAELCGWALARGLARSGEPVKISGYLGKNNASDGVIPVNSAHHPHAVSCASIASIHTGITRDDETTFEESSRLSLRNAHRATQNYSSKYHGVKSLIHNARFTHVDRSLGIRTCAGVARRSEVVRIVWILDSESSVAPLSDSWTFKKHGVKVVVESSGSMLTRQESQGVARLARALRGFSIGIALAGGGAKGMAHFGVLQALEESGVSFEVMSGTSAGAMAGILYASGMSPQDAIRNFQHDLIPPRLFRYLPN